MMKPDKLAKSKIAVTSVTTTGIAEPSAIPTQASNSLLAITSSVATVFSSSVSAASSSSSTSSTTRSFASVVSDSEKKISDLSIPSAQVEEKQIAWADMVDSDDDNDLPKISEISKPAQESFKLLSSLEASLSASGELLMPSGLVGFPRLESYFNVGIKFSQLNFVVDPHVAIDSTDTAYSAFWSNDGSILSTVIKSLKEEKTGNPEMHKALLDADRFFASMVSLPRCEEIRGSNANNGARYAAGYLTLIYQESRYQRTQRELRPLIKDLDSLRNELEAEMITFLPRHQIGAKRILIIAEAILKKNLRVILDSKCKQAKRIIACLENLSLGVLISPGAIVDSLARRVKVSTSVFNKKTKKKELQVSLRVLKPSIASSGVPLTPEEGPMVHSVNSILLSFPKQLSNLVKSLKGENDLVGIKNRARLCTNQFFNRTDRVNALIRNRRRGIRDLVIRERKTAALSSSSSSSSSSIAASASSDRITPIEWSHAETTLLSNPEEKKSLLTAIAGITETPATFEEIGKWTEYSFGVILQKMWMIVGAEHLQDLGSSSSEITEEEDS